MKKIRYGYINNKIHDMYIDFNITSYPVDIHKIFTKIESCILISYSKHMKTHNLTLDEMIIFSNSNDGSVIYVEEENTYLIFYNDLVNINRQRWTLAHELAHIVLGHIKYNGKTRIYRNLLSDFEYDCMESEANIFAAQLLSNFAILKALSIKNATEIYKICHLSKEASKNRFDFFKKNSSNLKLNNDDLKLIKLFSNFINKKICTYCGFEHYNKKIKFCPICSGSKFERSGDSMIYDDGYKLDKNSKAIKCPRCENEIIPSEGEYCNICGINLVNRCSSKEYDINGNPYYMCNTLASGNDRFCTECGNKTTYFEQGLLIPYNQYNSKKVEDIDDEFPF